MRRCHECQTSRHINIQKPALRPIETTDCWQLLGMDLFGPWPVTEQSNQYVCVLTDLFSKFVIAQAIPNKEAASVAKVVVSLCTTYGAPQRILTDQGREFNNKVRKYYKLSEKGL